MMLKLAAFDSDPLSPAFRLLLPRLKHSPYRDAQIAAIYGR